MLCFIWRRESIFSVVATLHTLVLALMHLWGAKKKKKEKYHSITSLISLSALFLSFSWFHSPSMPCTYFLSFFPYGNCECLASSVHGGESQVRISVTVESHKERGCWAELGTDIVSRILPSKLYLTEFSAYSRARSPRVFFFFFFFNYHSMVRDRNTRLLEKISVQKSQ